MTTDRIQPARPAAPADRPAQPGAGNGFAALLEVHAGSAHAPRRDEPARPDTPRDAAARTDAVRDDAASAAAQHGGSDESRSDAASGAAGVTAVLAQPEPTPVLDEARPSLIGVPVVATAPGQPAATAVAAVASAAIVVPAVVAESAPVAVASSTPAASRAPVPAPGQPVAPAVAAAPQTPEESGGAPVPVAPVAAPAAAPAATAPAASAPALQTPAPAVATTPVAAPVEGETPVVPAAVAAPTPEPVAVSPQAPAPAQAEPAQTQPQPTSTTSVAQPAATTPTSTTAAPERAVPLQRAPAAVATFLHVAAERGITHARMALRPAELGGIEIRLQATAAGIAAQVVADSPEAARLLAQAGDDLRRALEARDVTLLSLEVSTSSEQRSREGARGERTDETGSAPTTDHPTEADKADASITHSVIELPGGLLVDVLA